MITLLRGLGRVILGTLALTAAAAAQTAPDQAPADAACVRLESQLAIIDRGQADPARADQIKRFEDAVAKQQAELDRVLAQSHRQGCEGSGFFALFTGQSPQCGPLNSQVQQMRGNLDKTMSDLERLKTGNANDQSGARRAIIGQLAQNNCGPQYRAAAAAAGPGGFLDALLGHIVNPAGDGAPSGTYRTVCVRSCDGYFFPISYSTVPSRFADDQNTCQRLCPASEAVLYSYRNPGEDMNQAVSINSQQLYTTSPNAFRYRREFSAACSCRRPGQSWADALKNSDDSSTLERGDIVVTDQNAKALAQAPKGKPIKPGAKGQDVNAAPATPDASSADTDSSKHSVRTVGPPFVSAH